VIRPWPTREEQVSTAALRRANARNVRALLGSPDAARSFVTGGHLYLGVPAKPPWRQGQPREPSTWSPRTSEILAFDHRGRLEHHFTKSELVPFGERLPFDGNFPGGERVAITMLRLTRLFPRFAPSDRVGPLRTRGHVLGGAVCWENVFERPFRHQADRGAEAFLVLSNENWYGISEEMDQMVAATRFRAAETGRPVLRVANTGVTALFDGEAQVLAELPRGTKGYLGADLPLIDGAFRTPYQHFGWLIQPLIAGSASLLALAGWARSRRTRALVARRLLRK
jgi:apolipoprotein N-acyltransferase